MRTRVLPLIPEIKPPSPTPGFSLLAALLQASPHDLGFPSNEVEDRNVTLNNVTYSLKKLLGRGNQSKVYLTRGTPLFII